MPRRSLAQCSFFDPEFLSPGCLEPGTVPWLLGRFRSSLFPAWLLVGWRGEGGRGRKAWPAVVLLTLVFLRWTEEGQSRLGSVRRAKQDASWRAAMGLAFGDAVPDERTLRDFEAFLRQRHPGADVPRYLLVHEHIVRLCQGAGVVGPEAVWAADSTPMWCYGAVLDTVRLLGDGLRALGRMCARAERRSLADLATEWKLPLLLARSTKGELRIDWRDREARAQAVCTLAGDVLRIVDLVRGRIGTIRSSKRKPLLRRCRQLVRVIRDDFETDEQGRLVIARRVAKDRLISLTDPQARHGHKSRSRTFNGFKLHLVGDLVSGLVASVAVTPGNEHDGQPAHRLIARARVLFDDIDQVLADTAYGGARLRYVVERTCGVTMLAPPQPGTHSGSERLRKEQFVIDFEHNSATCPNGVTTTERVPVPSAGSTAFCWPADACRACPLKQACTGEARGRRRLLLHPYEQSLREAHAAWSDPEVRGTYRQRTQLERLIGQVVRHGARWARAFGLGAAQLQAHAIAAVCNLRLLALALANSKETALPTLTAA